MSQKDNLFYKNGYKDPGVYTWGVRGGGEVKEWGGFVLKHFWSFPELKLKEVKKGIMFLIRLFDRRLSVCLSVCLSVRHL